MVAQGKDGSGAGDFRDVIVRKPWGHEYLMYEDGTIGVWFLHIKQGAKTSMHCHPNKKTGLVVLSGEAVLSFLSGETTLKPVSKMMIREGLFHSTEAVSPEGAVLIEVETPCDKGNLVRLDDEYGREDKGYEGKDAVIPMSEDCLRLEKPALGEPRRYNLAGCVLTVEKFTEVERLRERPAGELVLVLEGGLCSKGGDVVLGPGDVVGADILHRLAERFDCPRGAAILSIRRESAA